MGVNTQLKGEVFPFASFEYDILEGSGVHPAVGDAVLHADGMLPALAEDKEVPMLIEEPVDFPVRCDNFHGIEAVKGVPGFQPEEFGGGQTGPVQPEFPVFRGIGFGLGHVGDNGVGRSGGAFEAHVIHFVDSGAGCGEEGDFAGFAPDGMDVNRLHFFARSGGSDEDAFLLGMIIAAPPRDAHPHPPGFRIGPGEDEGSVIAPVFGIPFADAVLRDIHHCL